MKLSTIALTFPLVAAWDGWSDCGNTDDMATLNGVTVSPDPPVKGVPLTFTFDMSLKEQLVGGTIDLDLKAGDVIPVPIKETDDLCDTFKDIGNCPIPAGPLKFSFDETVPKIFPEKHVHGTIQLVHSDSRKIACVKLDTNVGNDVTLADAITTPVPNSTTTSASGIPAVPGVVVGFLKGLLPSMSEAASCPDDLTAAILPLGKMLQDLDSGDMPSCVADFMQVVKALAPAKTDCKSVGVELQALLASAEHIGPAGAMANAREHNSDIAKAIMQAKGCHASGDDECFGEQLGQVLRLIITSDDDPTTTSVLTTVAPSNVTTTAAADTTTAVPTTAEPSNVTTTAEAVTTTVTSTPAPFNTTTVAAVVV